MDESEESLLHLCRSWCMGKHSMTSLNTAVTLLLKPYCTTLQNYLTHRGAGEWAQEDFFNVQPIRESIEEQWPLFQGQVYIILSLNANFPIENAPDEKYNSETIIFLIASAWKQANQYFQDHPEVEEFQGWKMVSESRSGILCFSLRHEIYPGLVWNICPALLNVHGNHYLLHLNENGQEARLSLDWTLAGACKLSTKNLKNFVEIVRFCGVLIEDWNLKNANCLEYYLIPQAFESLVYSVWSRVETVHRGWNELSFREIFEKVMLCLKNELARNEEAMGGIRSPNCYRWNMIQTLSEEARAGLLMWIDNLPQDNASLRNFVNRTWRKLGVPQ